MATYWHGWHESDPPSSPEEITRRSLQSACEEELLADHDVNDADVAVGIEQYDALPDDVSKRMRNIWDQGRDDRS